MGGTIIAKHKYERIIGLIVADKNGTHDVINSSDFHERLRKTLKAYQFTEAGIDSVFNVILGREEIPTYDDGGDFTSPEG